MDTAIIGMYCLVDDWLRARRHQESAQRTLVDAEVITIALTAARFFDGNVRAAQRMLLEQRYLTDGLSRSQYNRRLHRIGSLLEALFDWLGRLHKAASCENVFLIDSCPVPACDNIRIRDCRIYPPAATDDVFRGYHSSKRRWFYGLKVHLIVTAEGYPVEASLTPGSANDTKHLRSFEIDLPEGSVLYGDKAYGCVLYRRPSVRRLQYRALPAAKEKLKAGRFCVCPVPTAGLPQADRNHVQPNRADASEVDSRGDRPRFRTEGLPIRAGL